MGFDPKYNDIVDYILKITHEIWEEKGIDTICDTYSEGITLFTGTTPFTALIQWWQERWKLCTVFQIID